MDLRTGAEVPMTLSMQSIRLSTMNTRESLNDTRFKYGLGKNGGQFTRMLAFPRKKSQTKPMNTQTILETKNWTGLSLAELCDAGRIGSRETVANWVQDCINESHKVMTLDEVKQMDFAKVIADREQMISEICARFNIA